MNSDSRHPGLVPESTSPATRPTAYAAPASPRTSGHREIAPPPLPSRRRCHIFRLLMTALFNPIMADDYASDDDSGNTAGVATRTRAKTKKPTPYRVLMLNDDYTPMEFVVLVLQRFFRMDMEEATRVM